MIDNSVSAIAMSEIAQSGLNQQQKILGKIKELTIKANIDTNSEDKIKTIKLQINKLINKFNNISNQTNYKGTKLLKKDNDDDLSVFGEKKIINLKKVDTTSVSTSLKSLMKDFSTIRKTELLDKGIEDLKEFKSNFSGASVKLESNVRNYMTNEINTTKTASILKNINYGSEITNFSKTNILSQVGYLTQSHSNVNQLNILKLLQ